MTIIVDQNVSIKSGIQTWGPFDISDDINGMITFILARWTGQRSLSASIEMSFDAGTTWRFMASSPVRTPATLVNTWGQPIDLVLPIYAWKVCAADNELYPPGHPMNGQLTIHSTYADWTNDQIAAIYPGQRLYEADPGAFHNPEDTPLTGTLGTPLRKLRINTEASGTINSRLQVDVT